MYIQINAEDKIPAYIQIYQKLRQDIIDRTYPFQAKLPSKRMIAEESAVSLITVEHAYSLLCEEGYAESRERSGYYVSFCENDAFAAGVILKSKPNQESFNTNMSNDSEQFPISVIIKSLRKVLSTDPSVAFGRSSNVGTHELRTAIRDYLKRSRGIIADVEQIVIGSGSEHLYGRILQLLGVSENIFGLEDPSYKKIRLVYEAEEAIYEMLPLGVSGINTDTLKTTRANVLHITPYRSFPSGISVTASKMHEYLSWASVGGRYIIEDDYESEFSISSKGEDTLFSNTNNDNVIYMNTFSQTISPSLRAGYMVLPKHLVEIYEKKLGFYACTVPTFEQMLLTELLNSGEFERHINRVRRMKRKQKK